ncbi:MAG: hypothetical protein AAB400_00765 [Patescibacteria group bacterium]
MRNSTLIHAHADILSAENIEIDGKDYTEYSFADGSKIRILIPEQIEQTEDCSLDPDDDIEDQYSDNPDREAVPGFNCFKCGNEGMPLVDGIFSAVQTPYAALPAHIEECLGLEPIESEEGNVTTIRYR